MSTADRERLADLGRRIDAALAKHGITKGELVLRRFAQRLDELSNQLPSAAELAKLLRKNMGVLKPHFVRFDDDIDGRRF